MYVLLLSDGGHTKLNVSVPESHNVKMTSVRYVCVRACSLCSKMKMLPQEITNE